MVGAGSKTTKVAKQKLILKQEDRTILQFRLVECGAGERLRFFFFFFAKPTSSAYSLWNAGTSLREGHFQLGGSMVPDRKAGGDNTVCSW